MFVLGEQKEVFKNTNFTHSCDLKVWSHSSRRVNKGK